MFKQKAKKIFTNVRVIILLVSLVLALVSIHPSFFSEGVAIRSVTSNSSAAIAGISSPKANVPPMSRERIVSMNGISISDVEDYYDFVEGLGPGRDVHVETDRGVYKLTTREDIEIIQLNETEEKEIIVSEFDEELNKTINVTKVVEVNKTEEKSHGTEDIGLSVYDAPKTNIRKGLDLQGGTRVLLQPEENLDSDGMSLLIENMKYRLNVYGLSDIVVREAGDLSGNQYVMVEIAGAKEDEAKELLSRQGKFHATVGNVTVFKGGNDISHVCRTADCSGIDPRAGCGKSGDQWNCGFSFAISLSPEAARRQAEATNDLEIISGENGQSYLSEKLVLHLDNVAVDELSISSGLKGKDVTEIAISGGGSGVTREAAITNTLQNMKKLQTILITGSLPVELDIVKTDTISPIFGEEFVNNAIIMGILALLSVGIVVFVRYRKVKVVVPMFITSVSEVLVLLGFASLIGWNLDIAAVAGIIIAVGTGVDHLIVLTDETLRGNYEEYDWKKKIKNAFFIIMAAYVTTFVAMVPLWYAGAGMLKGFALTTILGVSIGVFIARPAYAKVVEILLRD